MDIALAILIPLGFCIAGMVICGDLRITPRQQREWEEEQDSLSRGEREWQGYLAHHIPGYGQEMTRADFGA